ncbi:MAG: ACT domain-containing protein, partial [Kiritimatiellae bacterium]|nr:ACT domain-containing protein [Kiritimatiellia bacterium]
YPKDAEGEKPNADIADIMMPHLGANTFEANYNAAKMAAEELIDLDVKGDLACIVNRDIPAGLERSYSDLAYTLANLVRQISGPRPVKMVETSFYGDLKPYQKWLLVSIIAGIWHDFDPYNDVKAAMKFLEENGIRYKDRDVSDDKGYGNSITLDVTVELEDKSMKLYSVRGTVTEGIQTVSRIDEFDRLYFEPKGVTLFCLYNDRPGVIATIARRLADAGINIEDMRNPHNVKTHRSLAILRLNTAPSASLVADIKDAVKAHSVVSTNV